MNTFFSVDGQTVCESCGNKILAEKKKTAAPPSQVYRLADPTVCGKCAFDTGGVVLPQIAGLHVCPKCQDLIRNRPFPIWVKGALAFLLFLAVFAQVRNAPYFLGYIRYSQAVKAFERGDLAQAAEYSDLATRALPGDLTLQMLRAFYRGIYLYSEDRTGDALREFESYQKLNPQDESIRFWIFVCRSSRAFETGDYAAMERWAQEAIRSEPDNPRAQGILASAYSCRFASGGGEEYREKALAAFRTYEAAETDPADRAEFEMRLRHRMTTREIIDRKEFLRRFPNGWTEGPSQ